MAPVGVTPEGSGSGGSAQVPEALDAEGGGSDASATAGRSMAVSSVMEASRMVEGDG